MNEVRVSYIPGGPRGDCLFGITEGDMIVRNGGEAEVVVEVNQGENKEYHILTAGEIEVGPSGERRTNFRRYDASEEMLKEGELRYVGSGGASEVKVDAPRSKVSRAINFLRRGTDPEVLRRNQIKDLNLFKKLEGGLTKYN